MTFLPHVQRVLYGEGSVGGRAEQRESPIRVYRRKDIAQVEVVLEKSPDPVLLDVAHVDLYFFYDADLVILALEVFAKDLPLEVVQDFDVPLWPRLSARMDGERFAISLHQSDVAGEEWRRAGYFLILRIEKNFLLPSVATVLPPSPRIGSFCLSQWFRIIQDEQVRSGTGSLSTTGCL